MKQRKIRDWLMIAVTEVVAGAMIYVFWNLLHPEVLNFQEEHQMFLWNGDYMCERLSLPGGVSAIIGGFIVQFFYVRNLGGLLLALLMLLMQLLVWKVLERMPMASQQDGEVSTGGKSSFSIPFVLSLLPLIWSMTIFDYIGTTVVYLVSLTVVLAFALLTPRCGNRFIDTVVATFLMCIAYWCCGPLVLLAWAIMVLDRAKRGKGSVLVPAAVSFVATLALFAYSTQLGAFPLWRFIYGVFYNRIIIPLPAYVFFLPVLIFLLALAVRGGAMSRAIRTGRLALMASLKAKMLYIIILLAGGVCLLPKWYDNESVEMMSYDYLLRAENWDGIVAKAEANAPTKPFGVCALNLALAQRGELCDRMFMFYQNGPDGLTPAFIRDFISPMAAEEVYWHVGLINTSQRYTFEAMEAIIDHQKSARAIKRLAQTSIINGQYGVARKYLLLLSETLFYARWAKDNLDIISLPVAEREKAIAEHPVYGTKRRQLPTQDYFFSEKEQDKLMGQLFVKDPDNTLAMQYLIAYPLLMRDPQRLMTYLGVVQEKKQYMPAAAREALSLMGNRPGGQAAGVGYAEYLHR